MRTYITFVLFVFICVLKGTVSVISSDLSSKEEHHWFTMVLSKISLFPSVNFPRVFSQVATSQMCNFPSGNFPNVHFPKLNFLKWEFPKWLNLPTNNNKDRLTHFYPLKNGCRPPTCSYQLTAERNWKKLF